MNINYAGKTIPPDTTFSAQNFVDTDFSKADLSHVIFKNVKFIQFITLTNNIRSDRGFIRCLDNNNQVFRIHPIDMSYSIADLELTIKGEERFQLSKLDIATLNECILINNEIRVDKITWNFDKEKLFLYDSNHYKLYNGVYWNEVTVNGAVASSKSELEGWLKLIK